MASKKPVRIGAVTLNQGQADETTKDIVVRVSDELFQVLGSPAIDPALLQGKIRTGPNGSYRYPKPGTSSGWTVTLFSDAQTTGGNTKTYQMQLPRVCPLHVLDKFLAGITYSGITLIDLKPQGGIRIPIGQTVVVT